MSIHTVIEKIKKMRQANDPDSPEMKKALTRIGGVLQGTMRQNVIKKKIVDFGWLLNSIKYEIDGTTLSVGSYGIQYAARNEYGGPMTHRQVAGMFAGIRLTNSFMSQGLNDKRYLKNEGDRVVTVENGVGFWKPRPFIGPALVSKRDFVIRTIRKVVEP